MGFLTGLLGHASEVEIQEVEQELAPVIIDGEVIQKAYKVIRDLYIFTDKRLILINKQGITGKKTDFLSLPYKSISHFSVETAGHFDLDSELNIWVIGAAVPIHKEFKKDSNVQDIQKALASYVLGK